MKNLFYQTTTTTMLTINKHAFAWLFEVWSTLLPENLNRILEWPSCFNLPLKHRTPRHGDLVAECLRGLGGVMIRFVHTCKWIKHDESLGAHTLQHTFFHNSTLNLCDCGWGYKHCAQVKEIIRFSTQMKAITVAVARLLLPSCKASCCILTLIFLLEVSRKCVGIHFLSPHLTFLS